MVAVAIGAIAGGAIGNVIDRRPLRWVVDFIHAHVDTPWGDYSWYVFNVADAAIVCGVAALILDSQLSKRRKERSAKGSGIDGFGCGACRIFAFGIPFKTALTQLVCEKIGVPRRFHLLPFLGLRIFTNRPVTP